MYSYCKVTVTAVVTVIMTVGYTVSTHAVWWLVCRCVAGQGRGSEGPGGPLQPDENFKPSQVAVVPFEGRFGAGRAKAPRGVGWGQLRHGRCGRRG